MPIKPTFKTRSPQMQVVVDNLPDDRGLAGLAEFLGVTRQTVSAWDHVPDEHLVKVESYTGVPRELQRPDLFGTPPMGSLHKSLVVAAKAVTQGKWGKTRTTA
jgi:hypothetical protein